MSMKLNVPVIDDESPEDTPSPQEVARFIVEGDKRPKKERAISRTFRLKPAFIDIMEVDALRMGLANTDILKAALAAWDSFDENTKNHWVLDSKKK